jgi:hypothetical protein
MTHSLSPGRGKLSTSWRQAKESIHSHLMIFRESVEHGKDSEQDQPKGVPRRLGGLREQDEGLP